MVQMFRKQYTSDYYEIVDISVGSMVGLIVRNQKPVQAAGSSESTNSSILVVALVRWPAGAKKDIRQSIHRIQTGFSSQFISTNDGWWTKAACIHTVCLCRLTARYVQGQRVCSMRIYLSCMKKFGRTNRLPVVQEPANRRKHTTDILQGCLLKPVKIDASAISRWLTGVYW